MAKVFWITSDDDENDCAHKHKDSADAQKCRAKREQDATKSGHSTKFHVIKVNQS